MLASESLVERLKEIPNIIVQMTEQGVYMLRTRDRTTDIPVGQLTLRDNKMHFQFYPYMTDDEAAAIRYHSLTHSVNKVLQQYVFTIQPFEEALKDPQFKALVDDTVNRAVDLILNEHPDLVNEKTQ